MHTQLHRCEGRKETWANSSNSNLPWVISLPHSTFPRTSYNSSIIFHSSIIYNLSIATHYFNEGLGLMQVLPKVHSPSATFRTWLLPKHQTFHSTLSLFQNKSTNYILLNLINQIHFKLKLIIIIQNQQHMISSHGLDVYGTLFLSYLRNHHHQLRRRNDLRLRNSFFFPSQLLRPHVQENKLTVKV